MSEQIGEIHAPRLQEIARLRLIVGYLGEKSQHNWWTSEFLSTMAPAFLTPVFGKTTILAQYHGVKEAACRVHDEYIGVGRVFHLFRLSESMEQAVFESLQDPALTEMLRADIESQDAAVTALHGVAGVAESLREGPVQIGTVADLDNARWLLDAARCYEAAFSAGSRSYPYFADSV